MTATHPRTGSRKSRRAAEVFISHASEDRDLALQLKGLLKGSLRPGVFCTSDVRDLEGGKAWFEQIMSALRAARVCVTILTPASIRRRWVLFESGGMFALAWGRERTLRMFSVTAGNLGRPPSPFDLIQSRDLRIASHVRQLIDEIAGVLGETPAFPSRAPIQAICSAARRGSRDWAAVSDVLAGGRSDASPFNLDSLLPAARRHVFCAGQNLNYLARTPRIRRQLTKWVQSGPSPRIELLICDPEETGAVDAWAVVGQKYHDDLHNAIRTFQRWKKILGREGIASRVDIRVTKLVTTSLTVIDPGDETGTLVVIPVVFGKPISAERPHFAISRGDHKTIFNHYWETYRDVFDRARSIEKVSLPGTT